MGIWAPPLAWAVVLAAGTRAGRLPWAESLAAALVVLAGLGLARWLAGSRGGLLGRAGELALLPSAVATMLAEPLGFRRIVLLAVAWLAAGLGMAGARHGRRRPSRGLALAAAAAAGAGLLPGFAGAPLAELKWLAVTAALLVTATALSALAGGDAAALAALALAAALGPAHTLPWLLPPLASAGLLALDRDWPVLAAAAGAACALLPPAGLVPGGALIAAAVITSGSAAPAWLALPAAALAWWRWPAAFALPGLEGVVPALPVQPGSLVFLLPLLALGLLEPVRSRRDGRLVLGLGLLLLPLAGTGDAHGAAAAAVWLGALAAAGGALRRGRGSATVPWTVAASAALLLLAPWGGKALPGVGSPKLLAGGWCLATVLSLIPHPGLVLAWLLPAAGLVWTVPVEGVDRRLAPGERLELAGSEGTVLLARVPGAAAVPPGSPLLRLDDGRHLRAGRDVPLPGGESRHPLLLTSGAGRGALTTAAALSTRDGGPLRAEATAPLILRAEPLGRWRARRLRFAGLVLGAVLLLLAALLAAQPPPVAVAGSAVALFAALAAGSGVAPLARLAFRGAPDLAALAFLAAWAALRPRLRSRFAAGALLLVPLALAQPLLRHPAGDEVYHLELMESLQEDGDLDISNNLDLSDPAQAIYAPHGDHLIHPPTEAILLLPGFAVLGRAGALGLLALAMAWALALAAGRAGDLGLAPRAVEAAWTASLLTYPAVTFAVQVWPAAWGALALALTLVLAGRNRPVAAAAAALSLAVKVRLALLTVPVAAAAVLHRRKAAQAALGLGVAAAAVVTLVCGSPLGRHSPAELLPGPPGAMLRGLWGLAWDPAGGLAFSAPLWLAALAGLAVLWRRSGNGERGALLGAAATLLLLAPRGEWYGGGSPPARYLVPMLPLVLIALAAALAGRRGRRLAALALPVAALASWVALTRPLWWFNPVDGGWWLADGLSRALHCGARRVFPSLLRPGPAVYLVPAILLMAAWWWSRRPRRGPVAVCLLGLVLAVGAAAGLPEQTVQAEDPQVVHRGGEAEPPPGTFARWTHTLAWRLHPGDALEIPWRPAPGHPLWARVRPERAAASLRLAVTWDGGRTTAVAAGPDGGQWQWIAIPRPPGPGRHTLHLRLEGDGALLVDRLEAR